MAKKIYILENLGCANCASKIESKINAMPEVEEATITFATKQLRITAEDPDALVEQMQKIANKFEPDIIIKEYERGKKSVPMQHHKHHHEHHHNHDEHCNCGCEHEHHGHHHAHEHDEHCNCGCEHEHEHHHEHCSCGCEHEHHEHIQKHHHENHTANTSGHGIQKIYLLENLDCAHCAAKMEQQIRDLDGVEDATITYATKQLRVTAEDPDALLAQMSRICSSIESEVIIVPRTAHTKSADKQEAAVSSSKNMFSEHKKPLQEIIAGCVLFVAGILLEHFGYDMPSLLTFVIAYIILGHPVISAALKNLTKGQVFDENFLMTIATIGAFAIGEFPEAAGVMLFYRIGELFEDIAVERSRSQIMDALDLRPEVVHLVTGNTTQTIPAEDAQVGDLLLVRPGDRIPLDGTIVDGESRIDTSAITGEPVPVRAVPGDAVTSGCMNTSGVLKIRVEKILEESMVSRILDSVENAAASKPKIDKFITRFARVYTPFVIFLAAATAIIPSIITGNWEHWVYTALTFLVISCPCALVLSVPLAFFSGIGAGSKQGILFKGGVSLEAMNRVKAVVMDKTGTITKGNFVVQECIPVSAMTADTVLTLCASCEASSSHPIAHSIVTAALDRGIMLLTPNTVEEIAGHGIRAVFPSGEVLCGNRKLMDQYQIQLPDISDSYGTEVFVTLNGSYIGHLLIADTVKEDSKEAIAALKHLGLTTAMLTGDAQASADAVAKSTGIDEVHAKLLPQDKLQTLNDIRSQHGPVMFVGDGINDAPVLAGADVGAAMGSGADAAIEAADIVFMTSSMLAVPQALAIAKDTNRISWQNVIFALAIKIFVMILGLAGFASMWMAVFADSGVAMLCVLNSIRVLYRKTGK